MSIPGVDPVTIARTRGALLVAMLHAGALLGSAAMPAAAAPINQITIASDVSQALTFGRFDPSLGLFNGFRVHLAAEADAAQIRIVVANPTVGSGIVETNDALKDGGPESSALFGRLGRPVPVCRVGIRSACVDTIEFADMPIPVPAAHRVPDDLPPPVTLAPTSAPTRDEVPAQSFLCPIHVPATHSCATSTDPAPTAGQVAETLVEPAGMAPETEPLPLLGAGLTTVGAAIALIGTGTVALRKASRRSRRRHRW